MWTKALIPVLRQQHTRILSTTTPTVDETYHAYFVNLKVNGQPFINTIVNIEICEDCKKLSNPEQCTNGSTSGHVDRESSIMTNKLYKPEDRDQMLREVYNQTISKNNDKVFDTLSIKNFINTKYTIVEEPSIIYIALDPSYGGSSLVGIIAYAYTHGKYVVILHICFIYNY